MRKNVLLPLLGTVLLSLMLWLFDKAYRELNRYADLKDRHDVVLSHFQQLSGEINNAAILDPDLVNAINAREGTALFLTDSNKVIQQLEALKAIVKDTLNRKTTAALDTLIRREIGWLLRSNVPDSIIENTAQERVAAFEKINLLVSAGIARTSYLIDSRKKLVNREIKALRTFMLSFVSLAIGLLVFSTISLTRQRKKTKQKEIELETAFNRVNDGVVSLNTNWEYTFLNDAALITHPLGKEKTIGKRLWDIHPRIKESIFWEKYREAMETKKVVELENYFAPLDTWFAVKVYPADDGVTIFFKDVSDRKKAEHQLSLSLKELNDYKVALDESSIVAITDQKGIIRHVNHNFCRISKYPAEELIGQDHRIINSGYHSKEFIRDIWVTIAHGKIWKGEIKNRARDGTYYWVDTTIVPFLDEQQKPYQYVAIRADITERKSAEENLVRSEKIYKTIASSIPGSVICLLDRDFRYRLIEGDMLEKFGYSRDKLLGNLAADILSPDVYSPIKSSFEKVLAGETVARETNYNGYDVISRYIPLKDEFKNVYAIMTVSIDVTALKKAQHHILELNADLEKKIQLRTEQLKKSNEELEAFSYSVSHDLRSPLRSIIGFSAILEEEYGTKLDAEAKRLTGIIKDNTLKMARLIDDLLTFSRTGKQQLVKTTIETTALVDEVRQQLLQQQENYANIRWNIHPLPLVQADGNTIRQVWMNLLSNAAKYSSTREQPVIEIGCREETENFIFYVKDNGVGFDEEYKDKLFKVFQRLHDAHEFEGTGVGLALVDKIIAKHDGKVWAEGKENEGAVFYFSLPR